MDWVWEEWKLTWQSFPSLYSRSLIRVERELLTLATHAPSYSPCHSSSFINVMAILITDNPPPPPPPPPPPLFSLSHVNLIIVRKPPKQRSIYTYLRPNHLRQRTNKLWRRVDAATQTFFVDDLADGEPQCGFETLCVFRAQRKIDRATVSISKWSSEEVQEGGLVFGRRRRSKEEEVFDHSGLAAPLDVRTS